MDGWLSVPIHESFNHDLAIRRFCPARVELERGEWEGTLNQIQSFCPADTITTPLAASEVDEFVDSFFNKNDDDDGNKSTEKQQDFRHFQGEIYPFSVSNDVYGDEMEMGASLEDLGVGETVPSVEDVSHGVDQGLHLVHLLLACAEAVGCRDTKLADSMLTQIWASVSPWGDSLQRVSYCFAMGLKSRLSLIHNLNANGTFTNGARDVSLITCQEKMEAFQLLHRTTPYIAFGFMAANEAICQVAQGKDSLHIIDLGMKLTLQYPSLIRTLASRPEGAPKLRITGLTNDQILLELEASLKVLLEDASSLGIDLEFNVISDSPTPSLLTRENLKLREGEALFVNSVMHLHKYAKESRGSLKAILQAIKKLGPTLLTVVEQDANHNGPFFLGRFLESLHYYSAVFDSLESSLPRNSPQRMKIERHHYAEEICNIVAREGSDRIERHERAEQWRRQLGRAGFQVMAFKCMSQARMMLSVYGCDGYTLASEKGCLLLGWRGRPIMLASAWQVNNVSSS
ncbi:GRAS domain-containing protein [Cephalotus follicularis]|uniref:GRAS domain-containing protein n=1 Tax=Cephalotus follicularis TaxID=3775 RepID=A0A1Q3C046_CEPFO|nr:GRAS domain-containing protein [Cephalotus follicularis]